MEPVGATVKRGRGRPRKSPPPPVVESSGVTVETETVYGFEMEEIFYRGGIPDPPKFILAELAKLDRAWRWLSAPHVRRKGTRGYTAYSPNPTEKSWIDAGKCAPGIRVSADNRVFWNEDAYLGWIPGKLHRLVKARTQANIIDQTKLSRNPASLREEAARLARDAGLKRSPVSTFTVEEEALTASG